MSREDLIKYIKKQGLLLQKSKGRCEGRLPRNSFGVIICLISLCAVDLTKECERLKKAGGGGGDGVSEGVAWEELQVVRSERDQATSQAKSLRQTVANLEHKNQVLATTGM